MKSLPILMMTVLSIMIIPVFAQENNTGIQQHLITKSKKELLKIEVMNTKPYPKKIKTSQLKNELVTNLSSKEQMKTSVMKTNILSTNNTAAINKSRKCGSCLVYSNLSLKEQMKMGVMRLTTPAVDSILPTGAFDKCVRCGVDINTDKQQPM